VRVSTVRFTPSARTAWHSHTVRQTLYVTEGKGLIQSRGGDIERICAGDVIYAPAERVALARRRTRSLHDPPVHHRSRPGQRATRGGLGRARHRRRIQQLLTLFRALPDAEAVCFGAGSRVRTDARSSAEECGSVCRQVVVSGLCRRRVSFRFVVVRGCLGWGCAGGRRSAALWSTSNLSTMRPAESKTNTA
jgi:hypothetical protein